jgi:hypothetical protein
MNDTQEQAPDNLVRLDVSMFSNSDLVTITALGDKLRLLYRWFRHERTTRPGLDQCMIFSGARTRTPYASYRIERYRDGHYALLNQRTDELITEGRTLNQVLDALPDDFFYSA